MSCKHEEAVYWNPYNRVVQCHKCGERFEPMSKMYQAFGNFFTRGKWAKEILPTYEVKQAIDCVCPLPKDTLKRFHELEGQEREEARAKIADTAKQGIDVVKVLMEPEKADEEINHNHPWDGFNLHPKTCSACREISKKYSEADDQEPKSEERDYYTKDEVDELLAEHLSDYKHEIQFYR